MSKTASYWLSFPRWRWWSFEGSWTRSHSASWLLPRLWSHSLPICCKISLSSSRRSATPPCSWSQWSGRGCRGKCWLSCSWFGPANWCFLSTWSLPSCICLLLCSCTCREWCLAWTVTSPTRKIIEDFSRKTSVSPCSCWPRSQAYHRKECNWRDKVARSWSYWVFSRRCGQSHRCRIECDTRIWWSWSCQGCRVGCSEDSRINPMFDLLAWLFWEDWVLAVLYVSFCCNSSCL